MAHMVLIDDEDPEYLIVEKHASDWNFWNELYEVDIFRFVNLNQCTDFDRRMNKSNLFAKIQTFKKPA